MIARVATLLCLIASMIVAGFAQQAAPSSLAPSREQVQKLLSVLGVEDHLDTMLQKQQGKVREGARSCFREMNPGAGAATLKRLDAAFAATPTITSSDVSDGLIAEVQKNLSADEVQAGIDFYSSAAGKGLQQKLPVILRNMRVSMGPAVKKKLRTYTSALNRTMLKFQHEMDQRKALGPHPGAKDASPGAAHSGSI